jgi:hypothetical protein
MALTWNKRSKNESFSRDTKSGRLTAKATVAALVATIAIAAVSGSYALAKDGDDESEKKVNLVKASLDEHTAATQAYRSSIALWKTCEYQHPVSRQGERATECFALERAMIDAEIRATGTRDRSIELGSDQLDEAAQKLFIAVDQYRRAGDDDGTLQHYEKAAAVYRSKITLEIDRLNR